MTIKLSKEHIEIMRHTRDRAAGGYYCGDSPAMQELVAAGLMAYAGRKPFVPGPYFTLTSKGLGALLHMSHARYIGGGVYAQFDGYGIMLTTGSHLEAECQNRIVLYPEVLEGFQKYMADLKERLQADPSDRPEQI